MDILTTIQSKPSLALQYAIDGIYKQSKRPDFIVAMYTYGDYDPDRDLCFGCAATCAIQEIANINFNSETIYDHHTRAMSVHCSDDQLQTFELAIDKARVGHFNLLSRFCGLNIDLAVKECPSKQSLYLVDKALHYLTKGRDAYKALGF